MVRKKGGNADFQMIFSEVFFFFFFQKSTKIRCRFVYGYSRFGPLHRSIHQVMYDRKTPSPTLDNSKSDELRTSFVEERK